MIRLQARPLETLEDAYDLLQTAIGVEFGTLPPYLYALFSIPPGKNPAAGARIRSVMLQEMVHMCLACNILNALGGSPKLTPPTYPGPLPGDIGPHGTPLDIHLLPLSRDAMKQAMNIEEPEKVPDFPILQASLAAGPQAMTIGQFYTMLDAYLATLPPAAWHVDRNQITDSQFFAGQIFAVNSYADANLAITQIISEGEGAPDNPLDFQNDIAHFYRFGEVFYDRVLTKAPGTETGYTWGPEPLGVDWDAVYAAISDPGEHDFSHDPPEAQAAQAACDAAYAEMVDELQRAISGEPGRMGNAAQAMFDLRMAMLVAFRSPLADPTKVSGPTFLYKPTTEGAVL